MPAVPLADSAAERVADHRPFEYLQVSRVVDLDRPPSGDERRILIDGAYSALEGQYPEGWPFLDAEALAASGHRVLDSLPALLDRKRRHWAAATGARRRLEVRYHMTDHKPVRATLAELGEPVLEVWTAPYAELARRWARHEPERAARFQALLDALPVASEGEAEIGEEMLLLLESIAGIGG